jgi:hypothetical protein
MIDLKFTVSEFGKITRTDLTPVISDSIGWYSATFTFHASWEGVKTALFKNGDVEAEVVLVNNTCVIPSTVLAERGDINVSVYCGDRKTANVSKVQLTPSGYFEATPPAPEVDTQAYVQTYTDETGIQMIKTVDDKAYYYNGTEWVVMGGVPGETGNSGVYIGSEEPTDPDVNVWIDPEGEEDSVTASDIPVLDAENNYTTTPKNTESVFTEVGGRLSAAEQAIANATSNTAAATTLADTGGYYNAPVEGDKNVELALAEIGIKTKALITQIYNANTEYRPTAVDTGTDTFTLAGHGLVNGNTIFVVLNAGEEWQQYLPNVVCGGISTTSQFYVVGKTTDTFQISLTSGGAAIDLTSNGGIPNAKWHFEKLGNTTFSIGSLPSLTKLLIRINGKTLYKNLTTKLTFNALGNILEWMGTTFVSAQLTLSFANSNTLYRNNITVDTSGAFGVFQYGISYGSLSTTANQQTNIDFKNFCPNRAGLVITSISLLDHALANGTTLEVWKL